MGSEIEAAVKELLRTIVREVVFETDASRSRDYRSTQSDETKQALLLNSREAAQALSISEPHLSRLTRIGVIPHVRVGKCLRYSVEALRAWIRQSESTESPASRTITTKNLVKPRTIGDVVQLSKATTKPRSKTQPKPVVESGKKKKPTAPARPKTRPTNRKAIRIEDENQRNPYAELLDEIGIDRSRLPQYTNGELMRISETDIATYHGWLYLNRPLPEEAREKLKKHFLGLVSRSGGEG
jgi:excisionase family DNA binding protein